ncbi:hypothetical protein BRADI_5g07666v3 [Brachypodium distachyon]|uniref:Uncharacterized protein n=1 Tax=Brachypodium distachyon TaxID=15368 RepID=A0A2K2CFT9_BRADI|nr:hypothetical protein BRADI_5g07666v3 [Brachypodium distachyon]PNT60891.1 hypothetical protein BRADI_5g07666v3 [Brachypodium distachyon]PNT60892.1 hypothetical protein BRADI_5g07666v3 [Brachypodium distachyon]PNT60893.1 hypothetical protein BRADI_5g07666v3 [Brachypodium distachyon]PNT60894.1 hypothetical protein BRADI_5g07666v3 [Brachypodium distachyon]
MASTCSSSASKTANHHDELNQEIGGVCVVAVADSYHLLCMDAEHLRSSTSFEQVFFFLSYEMQSSVRRRYRAIHCDIFQFLSSLTSCTLEELPLPISRNLNQQHRWRTAAMETSPALGKTTGAGGSGSRGGAPRVSLRARQHEELDGDGFGVVAALEEALGGEVVLAGVEHRRGAVGAHGYRSRGRRRLCAGDALLR